MAYDFNASVGLEVGQVMISGNDAIGPAGHSAFQDAVIRCITDDGDGFGGIDYVEKSSKIIDDFPGHFHLPAELLRQHFFDFIDDEWGGGIVDSVFPGQLLDDLGVATKVERRNDDVGINYHS